MKIYHILTKLFAVASAQTDWILPQFICPSNYLQNLKSADSAILVVNIGEIPYITDFIPQMPKISVENIKCDIDASVADMAEIVSGDSANVHAHQTLHFGLEHLLLLAHRVVQPQLRR